MPLYPRKIVFAVRMCAKSENALKHRVVVVILSFGAIAQSLGMFLLLKSDTCLIYNILHRTV